MCAEGTEADLYTVPFGDRHGGSASPLPGATNPHVNEYYPAFSPDDRFIAFTRSLGPYDARSPDLLGTPGNIDSNPVAEILVVPKTGGAPQRLAANRSPRVLGKEEPRRRQQLDQLGIASANNRWQDLFLDHLLIETREPRHASALCYRFGDRLDWQIRRAFPRSTFGTNRRTSTTTPRSGPRSNCHFRRSTERPSRNSRFAMLESHK